MFDKIKDFLYDISDMLLSLLIIAVIFYAVSWKISDTLKPNTDVSAAPIEIGDSDDDEEEPVALIPPEDFETPDSETDETGEDTGEEGETPDESVLEPTVPFELVSFVVDSGSSGYSIGKKLEEGGFVTSVNDFTKRIVELGVDGRLNAGEFKISKSDDLDTIINVLIGRGRN